MNVLVVGYGSMGKRRIRLLKRIHPEIVFSCVDNNPERLKQIKEDGFIGYCSLENALEKEYDLAFVCTSPGHHADIILKLIDAGINTFTELNLISDRYDEIITAAEKNNVKIFMSNTMLYDEQINAIIDYAGGKAHRMSYIYHVGQYLPDWHPWEDYRDFFIGKKETNGCREILAIQLPWIIELFGKIEKINVIKKKNTDLQIDFDDTYIISVEHKGGNSGVFVCDVLSRKAVSYLEIMGEERHLLWNGTPESLSVFDVSDKKMKILETYKDTEHIEGYADIISENQYVDEIKAFLSYVFEGKEPKYTLEQDKYVLDIIDEIEA